MQPWYKDWVIWAMIVPASSILVPMLLFDAIMMWRLLLDVL